MKTIGIVAEYNPFHNGHKYQIEQIRKQLHADNIIVVMSGNFVQRGGFAWTDKYLRTKMAMDCGADFVFELPAVFSCASAETFALGSVALLDSLGFVDEICFGSEEGSLELISTIADILNSKDYISALDKYLKSGLSFPAAREKFLLTIFRDEKENISALLKQPNNILAIEYIKAIKKLGSNIKPVTIKRMDSGYHSVNLSTTDDIFSEKQYISDVFASKKSKNTEKYIESTPTNSLLSSASAIRTAFRQPEPLTDELKAKTLDSVFNHLPKNVFDTLSNNLERFPADNSLFSDMMYYKLLSLKKENCPLDAYSDVSSDLSERIYKKLPLYKDFDSFAALLKTKQYAYTRITRALTHILLDIKNDDMQKFIFSLSIENKILYARLLGMNKEKSSLLRNITAIPVITKVADANNIFEKFYADKLSDNNHADDKNNENKNYNCCNYSDSKNNENKNYNCSNFTNDIRKMFAYDLFAADLYKHCVSDKIPDEFRAGIYII